MIKWNSDSITFILHILQIRFSLLTLLILPISISNLCEPNLNEVNNYKQSLLLAFKPPADRPTRRNQTGFNNESFVGWCAGFNFCSFQSSVFQMDPAHQPTRRNATGKYHMI